MVSSTPLTDDMLLEIFHLPLNSTYKFKCLSKVWLSNLSHPEFITKWFKINSKSLLWIQYYSTNDRRVTDEHDDKNRLISKMAYPESHSGFMSRNDHLFSLKFLMNQKPSGAELLVLGSSNGLVLCSVILYPRRKKTDGVYHVCNPLTQKWVSLPPYIEGFGVNAISCEYSSSFPSCFKVVRIREFESPSKKFKVDMFCSTLGVWESFQVSCDKNVVWGWSNNSVTLNGVLFWAEGGGMLVCDLNQKNGSGGRRCSLIDLPDRVLGVDEFGIFDSRIGESEGDSNSSRYQ
ncbi:F-box protein At5g41720-like [Papaver somniferum]|uniref:F-box protein At5g41720-like n=1 Tax=Papaver somniferum TaxID=3469 RepID=UPI000E6F9464|nr:F-box protein At5g41720-like [Papaver somniferum]